MKLTLIDIFESFDFSPDITWSNEVGSFMVNEQEFNVIVRPAREDELVTIRPFFPNIQELKVGNIEFAAIVNGKPTQDTTGLVGSSSMKVFAGVAQAVTEKADDYDVLLAITKRGHSPTSYDKRVSAYYRIIATLSHKKGKIGVKISQTSDHTVYAIVGGNLLQNIENIKDHLDLHIGSKIP